METRRSSDKKGMQQVTCWVAHRLSEFWNWVDERDIDKHVVSLIILGGTWRITEWGMMFADKHPDMDGLKMSAIIAAVVAPYMVLQGAAIKLYFDSRQ